MATEPLVPLSDVMELKRENERLRAAFNAAYNYIHSSQDIGAESQARYTAWLEARDKVQAHL